MEAVSHVNAVGRGVAVGGHVHAGAAAGQAVGLVPGPVADRGRAAVRAVDAVGQDANAVVRADVPSRTADESDTAPKSVQVTPPSVEYCQMPL